MATFGIREIIRIKDDKLREERLVKINDKAISNGFVSSEISGRIKRTSSNNSASSVGRELREELSVDTRESSNNETRVSREDGNERVQVLNNKQYSLKDNLGNELSKEQAEFFKDSKVRDENGNLLVVYHGTNSREEKSV